VKVKVYQVGYIIVIHNDTWSTKYNNHNNFFLHLVPFGLVNQKELKAEHPIFSSTLFTSPVIFADP
jgi:hypothetical protein